MPKRRTTASKGAAIKKARQKRYVMAHRNVTAQAHRDPAKYSAKDRRKAKQTRVEYRNKHGKGVGIKQRIVAALRYAGIRL